MNRIILPVTVLLAMLVLLGLGTWQMQRLAWKEALIAGREASLAQPPSTLPGDFASKGDAEAFEFRAVMAKGVFRHDLEQLFGAIARANVLGHHLLTPLVRDDGAAVLIDRGWVPADRVDPAKRPEGQLEGEVTIRGIARYRGEDQPGMFTPDNDPAKGQWYSYDLEAMALALGLDLLPVVIEADDAENPGGLPIGGRTRITLSNNHLHYALTWYGLAVALAGVYILYRRKERRV